MDNHHDHHENAKPSNKWVATPILLAFLSIAALVTFLSLATGTCCGGTCKDKVKTEEHGVHDTEHGEHRDNTVEENNEALKDSTTTTDTTATHENHDQHEGHGDGHGH
jgi:hypothetical protein